MLSQQHSLEVGEEPAPRQLRARWSIALHHQQINKLMLVVYLSLFLQTENQDQDIINQSKSNLASLAKSALALGKHSDAPEKLAPPKMFDKSEGLGTRSELGRERKEGSEELMQIYISTVFLMHSNYHDHHLGGPMQP